MELSDLTTYQAGIIQASMNRKLQKVTDAILSQYGLTKMQWFIIGTVLDAQQTGIRLSELSEKLGTTMSYLTTAINLLEARGILERKGHVDDTRSKLIVVTERHLPMCRQIEATLRNGLRKSIYSKIDPTEFRTYIEVMEQLVSIDVSDSSAE